MPQNKIIAILYGLRKTGYSYQMTQAKKKIGRPSVGDKAKSRPYTLKFSEQEYEDVKRASDKAGKVMAIFCREIIFKRVNKILKD